MKRCWGYGVLGGGVLLLCGLGGVLWGEGGGEVLSVVVRAGAADPQPAGVGQVVRVALQGQVVNPPVRPSSACVVRGPYWSWWVQEVRYRSSLGEAWGASPGSVSWQVQPVAGSPGQAVLLLTCPQGGYWQVTVAVQVEYEDPPCSDQWQGTGTATLELMVVSVTFWPQPVVTVVGSWASCQALLIPIEAASQVSYTTADNHIATVAVTSPDYLTVTGMATGTTQLLGILAGSNDICGSGEVDVDYADCNGG
jgi:hypothetical protein